MIIIEWIAFAVFVFFTVGWLYGARTMAASESGINVATLATTLQMTVLTLLMLFGPVGKLNAIWLLPVLIIISGPLNLLMMSVPVIGQIYAGMVRLFGRFIMVW